MAAQTLNKERNSLTKDMTQDLRDASKPSFDLQSAALSGRVAAKRPFLKKENRRKD